MSPGLRSFTMILLLAIGALVMSGLQASGATPEDTKKYLDATKALRDGDFQTAKSLLEDLMKTSQDTDLLLKADDKLTEALNGLKNASLPRVPGVYALKKSGTLVALNKEPTGQAQLMKEGASTLIDAVHAPFVRFLINQSGIPVASNELTGFILYNPDLTDTKSIACVYLELIKAGTRRWVGLPEAAQNTDVWVEYPEWTDVARNGAKMSSDMLIKTKLADGMYQISFPAGFAPPEARNLAIVDGTGYAYPLILQPSSVDMVYAQYVNEGIATDEAVKAIKDALASTPDDPLLSDAMTVTWLRRSEYEDAIASAKRTVELAEKANHPQLDLYKNRLGNAEAGKITVDVRSGPMRDPARHSEALQLLGTALQRDPKCSDAMSAMAEIYQQEKDLSKAAEYSEKAFREAQAASDPKAQQYERQFRSIKLAQLRGELEASCQGDQSDVTACIDKAKEALRYDDDSPDVNIILARLYDKTGKPADAAKKAEKAAKAAEKQKLQTAPSYYQFTASMCAKNGKPKDAVKNAQKAIDAAGRLGVDATPFKTDLALYQSQSK